MISQNKEIKWINCAKFVAIAAVLIDHSEMVLYDNPSLAIFTYFSVSVFVFISGMLSYKSCCNHKRTYFQTVRSSLSRIVPAYLLSILINQVAKFKIFDLKTYIEFVTGFNINAHFYYVALYIQLMLFSVVLYRIIVMLSGNKEILRETLLGAILILFSVYSIAYTNINNIYGGGGKLLGGTYLFIFYLGMLAMKHNVFKELSSVKYLVIAVISFVFTFFWWRFECRDFFNLDKHFPFGDGINPPGISTMIMTFCMLALCYSCFSLFENTKYFSFITDMLSKLGKHTLYIYLYHMLILDVFLIPHMQIGNIWIKRFVYLLLMVTIPIIIEYIVLWVKDKLVNAFRESN